MPLINSCVKPRKILSLIRRAADRSEKKESKFKRLKASLAFLSPERMQVLMLPAPAKKYEEPKDPLQDPVGRVTEDELGQS
jgi:hypothetical protein